MVFLSTAWSWISHWLIGWGGVGAIVAALAWVAWFFTPAFLKDYKSQLLHIAVAATVFTLSATYFYSTGFKAGNESGIATTTALWDAANERAAIAARERDEAAAAEAERMAKQATEDVEKQTSELKKQVDDYAAELAKRKAKPCDLTDDDIRRMLDTEPQ